MRGQRAGAAPGIPFRHFRTTDFGVEKGKTQITGDLTNQVALKIAEEAADESAAESSAAV